jgi:hypothetical protein
VVAAVAEVRKKAEVLVVLVVRVAVVLAQFQHQTELLEPLTQVAVAVELVELNLVLAVQESSSFVIQIHSERWPLSAQVSQAQRERTHLEELSTGSIHLLLGRGALHSDYGTLRIS